uniref:Serine aminopeptidase S33 domain-containing protein n=1 Tax=Eiseniibacteriota bacterium TaxID=2212470 RepID=A0A832I426_UNCEI
MDWRETPAELERARAEEPSVFESADGRLFGLFTPPAPAAEPSPGCLVFFTRPRCHRNRMWVEAARRFAARGWAAFRFDYHGCGDSEGERAPLDPNRPYRADAVAALRHLRRRHGQRAFVLVGSCFDARTALSAFVDEAAALRGLVFMAAPVMELDTMSKASADHKDWRHIARALRNPANWAGLGRRERWRHMSGVLWRVARRSAGARAGEGLGLAPSFVEHFDALARSSARALFLYGRDDQEYASFRVAEERLLPALPPAVRARLEVEVWPGALHGFLDLARQRATLDRIADWLEGLTAGGGRSAAAGGAARHP